LRGLSHHHAQGGFEDGIVARAGRLHLHPDQRDEQRRPAQPDGRDLGQWQAQLALKPEAFPICSSIIRCSSGKGPEGGARRGAGASGGAGASMGSGMKWGCGLKPGAGRKAGGLGWEGGAGAGSPDPVGAIAPVMTTGPKGWPVRLVSVRS
jgi:hypothetical protein